MGLRRERLADEIRDLLASCFQGGFLNDPRLSAVTITAVKLTADLQIAKVYYRVYSDDQKSDAQTGLERAGGFLRKQLADSLEIRRVPNLNFLYDDSVEQGSKIEKIIVQIKDSESDGE